MRTSGVRDGSNELGGREATLHDPVRGVGRALRGDVDPFVENDMRDGFTGDAQAEIFGDDSRPGFGRFEGRGRERSRPDRSQCE